MKKRKLTRMPWEITTPQMLMNSEADQATQSVTKFINEEIERRVMAYLPIDAQATLRAAESRIKDLENTLIKLREEDSKLVLEKQRLQETISKDREHIKILHRKLSEGIDFSKAWAEQVAQIADKVKCRPW